MNISSESTKLKFGPPAFHYPYQTYVCQFVRAVTENCWGLVLSRWTDRQTDRQTDAALSSEEECVSDLSAIDLFPHSLWTIPLRPT